MSRNSNIFHYIVIISIARLIPPSSGHPSLGNLFDYKERTESSPSYDDVEQNLGLNENRLARLIAGNDVVCEVTTRLVDLTLDGYDVFPSEWLNKTCSYNTKNVSLYPWDGITKSEVCFHDDDIFGCETLFEDLHVLKRKLTNRKGCWERYIIPVGVGCKCKVSVRNY